MKLRLRHLDSKETLKIEAPSSSTLPQLKQILSQTLPNSPAPTSIRLSLNRKDELQSDGEDSIQTLGIASGDLIYFSIDGMASYSQNTLPPECSTSSSTGNTLPEAQMGTVDDMELVDNDIYNDNDGESGLLGEVVVDKSFSVPGFLRKVFVEELGGGGGDSGRDHKLIVIAVHAVMLESGFLGFDRKEKVAFDGVRLRSEWSRGLFGVSLSYALPESFGGVDGEEIKAVVLKFQSLGKFFSVYGFLENGSGRRGTHWVRLNEEQLVPFLNVVWANCGVMENVVGKDGGFLGTSPQKEVFRFWRTVKDNLAFPLLIDLCEEAGLELPPCFMRLPTDLKLKILEMLSGDDVATMSCVCSELRYLGSSDDLWKLKFEEEFANEKKEVQWGWKKAFAVACERRNRRRLASRVRSPNLPAPYGIQQRRRRQPISLFPRGPRIFGGEYDVWPGFGGDLGTRFLNLGNQCNARNFSPPCNLGNRGSRII